MDVRNKGGIHVNPEIGIRCIRLLRQRKAVGVASGVGITVVVGEMRAHTSSDGRMPYTIPCFLYAEVFSVAINDGPIHPEGGGSWIFSILSLQDWAALLTRSEEHT